MQHELSSLAGDEHTIASLSSVVDLPGEVGSVNGGDQVGNDTGHSEVQSLLGDVVQAEGVLDNFLYAQQVSIMEKMLCMTL